MSDSWQPHELQHTRPLCPSPAPRVCSKSCPLSLWWHPTISSSVVPFSSCLQSFPASRPFPRSQFFASGGQRMRASASASVLPMNIQSWFPLGLPGLISLQSKGLSRVFSSNTSRKHQLQWAFNTNAKASEEWGDELVPDGNLGHEVISRWVSYWTRWEEKARSLNKAPEKKKWKKPRKELVLWREALKLWCLPAWTCGGAPH